MAAGDININSFRVGNIDLSDPQNAVLIGFNVYEDILSPFGPVAEARVLDHTDQLGKNDFNGSEKVEISFSTGTGGQSRTFNFKLSANKNLNDGSVDKSGSGHAKQYNLRMVSEEMVKAQQKHVQKTFNNKPAGDAVKDIVKSFSDKDVETEETKKQRLQFDREHPIDALKKVYGRSVSTQNKSSLFMLYQTGDGGQQKYRYETWEKAFQRSSNLKFKQNFTIAAKTPNEQEQNENLLWFKVSDSFKSVTRGMSKTSQTTYNRETGVAHRVKQDPEDNFKVAGNPVYKASKSDSDKPDTKPPVYHMNSPSNEKSDHGLGKAKANRAAFLSHLAQNSAEFECIGNPEMTVGKIIDLDIPNKSQDGSGANEKQFSGKALVVAVRHKIKPLGQTPRYTCVVRVVKAAYDQGGGKEA